MDWGVTPRATGRQRRSLRWLAALVGQLRCCTGVYWPVDELPLSQLMCPILRQNAHGGPGECRWRWSSRALAAPVGVPRLSPPLGLALVLMLGPCVPGLATLVGVTMVGE